ncbi:MAG: hypothetical protein IIA90_00240 [Chloroflexi bacterium]|nr:hypothetical protein [Chloroflexota bacterium]
MLLAACSDGGGDVGSETASAAPSETAGSGQEPLPDPTADAPGELPRCGSESEFFSVSPVAMSDFMGLVPLGNLAPSGHVFPTDHIYFHINRIDRSQWYLGTVEVPVVSPGDVWVTEIRSTRHFSDGRTDYSIYFAPCEELQAFFIHMSSLTGKLQERFSPPYDACEDQSTGDFQYEYCTKTIDVKLSAGELIGSAGGNEWQNALDLGVSDSRADPQPYAQPSRWTDRTRHIVCPLDYFTADVRDALRAKLGSHDGTVARTAPPACGEVEQDEPGTAQGAWFAKEVTRTYPEDPHLALVHDNVDPSLAVFSVGTSMAASGLPADLYYFDPADSGQVNRDFKDVEANGTLYCYETRDRFGEAPAPFVILLQMTNPTTLRTERLDRTGCGEGPWQFSSAYADYDR